MWLTMFPARGWPRRRWGGTQAAEVGRKDDVVVGVGVGVGVGVVAKVVGCCEMVAVWLVTRFPVWKPWVVTVGGARPGERVRGRRLGGGPRRHSAWVGEGEVWGGFCGN